MAEQSRILTGFDCEFLIGGNYLARIFAAAHRSGSFLNHDTINDPLTKAFLELYGVSIDSTVIKVKGTIGKQSFIKIDGIDNAISQAIYLYLNSKGWLSNNTLTDDFNPDSEEVSTYLQTHYGERSEKIIDHLKSAILTTNLYIEEPYSATIFDDKRPVDTLLKDTFVSLTETDVDSLVAFIASQNWLGSDGRISVGFDVMSHDVLQWLEQKLPLHKYTILYVLKDYYNNTLSLREFLIRALTPLTQSALDALIEFMKSKQWLTGGGKLYPKLDKIMDELEPWLEENLPGLREMIVSVLSNQPDIRIHIPIKLEGTHTFANGDVRYLGEEFYELILFMPMEITDTQITLGDAVMHHNSVAVLNSWGAMVEKPNLGTALLGLIQGIMPDHFAMGLVPSGSIYHIAYKKLKSSDEYAPAYGIYCNLKLDLRALPADFEIESYNHPPNMVGEKVEISPEGHLLVKDKNGNDIDAKYLVYSVDEPEKNTDTILYHAIGNITLKSITADAEGHLSVEYKDGTIPPLEEIVELSKKNLPRGNINKAQTFLRPECDFAVGIAAPVLRRLEKSQWNSFYVPFPEAMAEIPLIGDGFRPLYDPEYLPYEKKQIGEYKDFDLSWQNGAIKCVIKLEYHIDYWPDADVYCRVMIRPAINDFRLNLDAEIEEFNVDTGIAGDILAFIIGTLTMGPWGMIGGVVGLEVAEYAIAESQKKQQQETVKSQAAGLFSAIPAVIELFSAPGNDIAYYVSYGPAQLYQTALVNDNGLFLAGKGGVAGINHTLPVSLSGRTRDAHSWELINLVYTGSSGTQAEIPYPHAKYRIKDNSLPQVTLTPQAQYRRDGRIHSLQFTSGVDLQVHEIIQMVRDGIIFLARIKIHVSKNGREYLRSMPDVSKGNNLSELPDFEPADI